MALADLWVTSSDQLRDKHIQQIIAFAGAGKLRDGDNTSREYRQYLSQVPSSMLTRYVDECLSSKFDGSGLALQDILNEVGRRLDFTVTFGRYRGVQGQIGFDGIWDASDSKSIIVEVKTTDAYRIDLDTIAGYRRALIQSAKVTEDKSSILIVVGREDTGDLEAQVRGSRHAWDIRLISVDALLHLLHLKENVEDPLIVRKIRDILTPQEFTKVDGIVDIVFSAAEDVRQDDEADISIDGDKPEKQASSSVVQLRDACLQRIQAHVGRPLVKLSRTTYVAPDGSLSLVCAVSREYPEAEAIEYWYAFHPYQRDALAKGKEAFIGLGCGSEKTILLIPFNIFGSWLDGMHVTQKNDRLYWHVKVSYDHQRFYLIRKKGVDRIELTRYLLKETKQAAN